MKNNVGENEEEQYQKENLLFCKAKQQIFFLILFFFELFIGKEPKKIGPTLPSLARSQMDTFGEEEHLMTRMV